MKLMNDIKFINSYSFIFSARPGTPAFNLKKINQKDAKRRLINFKILRKIKKIIEKSLIKKMLKYYLKIKLKMKINILVEMNILIL